MAKDHSLRGASKYDPGGCEGGESCPLSSERKEEKPSQAVAVCGKSRTHGDNGGEGKTPFVRHEVQGQNGWKIPLALSGSQ